MELKNKKFTDIKTGKVLTVIDQFENIAILSDKTKIDARKLLDRSSYDEYIDPNNFFKTESTLNYFADKIKSIPNDVIEKIQDNGDIHVPSVSGFSPTTNESAVLPYDHEDERRMLEEKVRQMTPQMKNSPTNNQFEMLKDIIGSDDEAPSFIKTDGPKPTNDIQRNVNNNVSKNTDQDPIQLLFKSTKKNQPVNISLDFEYLIPRSDLIKMLEDSYDESIIDYLTNEFTSNIIGNPILIKQKIKEKITNIVYKDINSISEESNKE